MHTSNNRIALLFRVLLSSILFSLAPTVASAAAVGSPVFQAARSDGELTYTVKANDTLWDIAAAYGISVDALTAANPSLDPQLLHEGQVLVIPGGQTAPAPATDGATHTVSPNDTLWDIATAYHVSVDALVAANPGIDPKTLQNGQVLIIPAAGEGTATATAGTPPAPVSTPYTIRQNDTLWTIAVAFDVSVDALTGANPGVDPKRLRTGQVLQVPGVHAAPQEAAPPTEPAPAEAAPAAEQPPAEQPPAEQPPAEQPPAEQPPAEQPPPPPAGMPAEFAEAANQLLARMNEQRAARGIGQLTWNAELAAAAQAHANDCAARNKGSHVSSDGARLEARLARAGYAASASSENWANSRSIPAAFDMWFNEPAGKDPHRRNILFSRYTEIGIGVAKGGWGYYIIADFGSR